eukprot:gene10470-12381_t
MGAAQCDVATSSKDFISSLEKLEKQVAALEVELVKKTNSAFVFIKPHATTPATKKLVKEGLMEAGISIISEGEWDSKAIDEKLLIDNHYGAIASKAMKVKPAELSLTPKAKELFKKTFGMTWEKALSEGRVYNAADACSKLNTDGKGIDAIWSKLKKDTDLIKFGGGFYCGKVKDDVFVINGFYMAMRGKFTEPPAKIDYFVVEWDAAALSWEDFRGKVLGATDPSSAEAGSLRRAILEKWQELGLDAKPFTGDNGVHASASPFEAMAERINWVGASLESDPFAKAMRAAGIPDATIAAWTQDPQVLYDGAKVSLFDTLEDVDTSICLEKIKKIAKEN